VLSHWQQCHWSSPTHVQRNCHRTCSCWTGARIWSCRQPLSAPITACGSLQLHIQLLPAAGLPLLLLLPPQGLSAAIQHICFRQGRSCHFQGRHLPGTICCDGEVHGINVLPVVSLPTPAQRHPAPSSPPSAQFNNNVTSACVACNGAGSFLVQCCH